MRPRDFLCVVAAACAVVPCPPSAIAEVEGVVVLDAQSPPMGGVEATRRKLRDRVDILADRVPLRELIEGIARKHQIALRFDEAAIRQRGISLAAAVTISIGNHTLQAALGRVLDRHGLKFSIEDEGVLVSPAPFQPRAAVVNEEKMKAALPAVRQFVPPPVRRRLDPAQVLQIEVINPQPPDRVEGGDAPDNPPVLVGRIRVALNTFDRWIFGAYRNADMARAHVSGDRLRQRIGAIDRECRLSEAQIKKLELAGRGDVQRFFDQVDEARKRFEHVRDNRQKAVELLRETEPLSRVLSEGLFEEGSLFAKTLQSTLTPEQLATWKARSNERTDGSPADRIPRRPTLERMLDFPRQVPAREVEPR